VKTGDLVELDVAKRKLHLHVSERGAREAAQGVEAAKRPDDAGATGSSTSIT
jgi:dihydroxyacid dehydratase/phosphogluconate dehydratase